MARLEQSCAFELPSRREKKVRALTAKYTRNLKAMVGSLPRQSGEVLWANITQTTAKVDSPLTLNFGNMMYLAFHHNVVRSNNPPADKGTLYFRMGDQTGGLTTRPKSHLPISERLEICFFRIIYPSQGVFTLK